MSIGKKQNTDYSSGIPVATGDRYYAQDLGRDFNFLRGEAGKVLKNILGVSKAIISGGVVTQVSGQDKIDVSAFIGYAPSLVAIPDSFVTFPPSITTADIDAVEIKAPSISAFNLVTQAVPATLNGIAYNYIKMAYAETNGNTRTRKKLSGTYSYEKIPSYVLSCNAVAPTSYEVCLGVLVGNSGGSGYNILPISMDYNLEVNKNIQIFTASGTWVCPPNVTKIKLILVGPGGAGGQGQSPVGTAGGGGGGSGQILNAIVALSGNKTITINGTGTTFDTLTATSGANGSDGSGGTGGNGGNGTNVGGSGKGTGVAGVAGGGYGSGGAGGSSGAGGGGGGGGGAGWQGSGGKGGDGISGAGRVGGNGTGYGSGGGGGGSGGTVSSAGGTGAPGIAIVQIIG